MKKINIKDSVKNNVSSIAEFHTQTIDAIGLVKQSNSKNNTCTILYKSFDNAVVVKTDVQVRLANPTSIDWFPKKDDYVLVRESAGIPIVVGDANQIVKGTNKESTKFAKNIYASVSEAMGGFLV